jgi:hypothetical protein
LHKTLAEIDEMPVREYRYWVAWWELEAERRKRAKEGGENDD